MMEIPNKNILSLFLVTLICIAAASEAGTNHQLTTETTPTPTLDPWIQAQLPPGIRVVDVKANLDQWIQTSLGQNNPINNLVNSYNSNNARQFDEGGSTADCQDAINRCSLFSVDPASLDSVYQQAFAAVLKKQRLSYQASLKKTRDFFINVLNQVILNPDQPLDSMTCSGAMDTPVHLLNDPTEVIPLPDSVDDVTVPSLAQCVVSQWSEWSLPLSFGIIERQRKIVQQGQCCPDPKFLVERVNITSYRESGDKVFEDPDKVAENFNNDFLNNNQPRDILMIIDTSSSIFQTDFQVMKEGMKIMIDLFCGGFGEGEKNNRLAILQFSSRPVIVHYFKDPQTPEALKAKVDSMVDFGGRTCTGLALIEAHDEIFQLSKGVRPNTPNDTLIVTDGHANCGPSLTESARYLQQRSQAVYALGIGISGDVQARAQVTSIVTNENPHHIFSLARYTHFKQMIEYIKQEQHGKTCTPIISTGKK